MSSQFNLVVFP